MFFVQLSCTFSDFLYKWLNLPLHPDVLNSSHKVPGLCDLSFEDERISDWLWLYFSKKISRNLLNSPHFTSCPPLPSHSYYFDIPPSVGGDHGTVTQKDTKFAKPCEKNVSWTKQETPIWICSTINPYRYLLPRSAYSGPTSTSRSLIIMLTAWWFLTKA